MPKYLGRTGSPRVLRVLRHYAYLRGPLTDRH